MEMLEERKNNYAKRTEASEKRINEFVIDMYKDVAYFEGATPVSTNNKAKKREYQKVATIEFDGMKDFVFCSNDVNE